MLGGGKYQTGKFMALTVHFPCAIIIIIRLSQLVVGRDQLGNNFPGLKQADPLCPQATLLSHCLIKSLWQLVFVEGLSPKICNVFPPSVVLILRFTILPLSMILVRYLSLIEIEHRTSSVPYSIFSNGQKSKAKPKPNCSEPRVL
jgi:hypothetical protein